MTTKETADLAKLLAKVPGIRSVERRQEGADREAGDLVGRQRGEGIGRRRQERVLLLEGRRTLAAGQPAPVVHAGLGERHGEPRRPAPDLRMSGHDPLGSELRDLAVRQSDRPHPAAHAIARLHDRYLATRIGVSPVRAILRGLRATGPGRRLLGYPIRVNFGDSFELYARRS